MLDWKISYSLHLDNERKFYFGPYWDHACLHIIGNFIYPDKLIAKNIEMRLLGDRRDSKTLNNPDSHLDYERKCIGGLTVRGETREYLGSLPFDTFSLIVNALSTEKLKYLILIGYILKYGSADIFSVHFEEEFDRESWI
jgi:hypothetical protein